MVAVMLLEDALRANPVFDYHTERTWTTALIKNFDSNVWFHINHDTKYDDYSVEVLGIGKNTETGEPIQFITKQTGL